MLSAAAGFPSPLGTTLQWFRPHRFRGDDLKTGAQEGWIFPPRPKLNQCIHIEKDDGGIALIVQEMSCMGRDRMCSAAVFQPKSQGLTEVLCASLRKTLTAEVYHSKSNRLSPIATIDWNY